MYSYVFSKLIWILCLSFSLSLTTTTSHLTSSPQNRPCFIICDPLNEHGTTAEVISQITQLNLRAIPLWSTTTGKKLLSTISQYDDDDDDTMCNVRSFHPTQIAPKNLTDRQGTSIAIIM